MLRTLHDNLVSTDAVHTQKEAIISPLGTALRSKSREAVVKSSHPPVIGAAIPVGESLPGCHTLVAGAEGTGSLERRWFWPRLASQEVTGSPGPFAGHDNPLSGCRVLSYLGHIPSFGLVSPYPLCKITGDCALLVPILYHVHLLPALCTEIGWDTGYAIGICVPLLVSFLVWSGRKMRKEVYASCALSSSISQSKASNRILLARLKTICRQLRIYYSGWLFISPNCSIAAGVKLLKAYL